MDKYENKIDSLVLDLSVIIKNYKNLQNEDDKLQRKSIALFLTIKENNEDLQQN